MESRSPRLEQFSDGVFAIAITLLALDLKVPHLSSHSFTESLVQIIPLLPTVFAFILSFITIAIFWVNHQQLLKSFREPRRRILWGNVFLLLCISVIPFATQVVGENMLFSFAVFSYSAVLFAASFMFSVLRLWIHHAQSDRRSVRRSLVGPLFYFLAVVTSLLWVPLAYLFLLVPPLFYFFPRASHEEAA